MGALTVSPNRELVIPADQTEALGLRPGQEVAIVRYQGSFRLVPVPTVEEMQGAFPGLDTEVDRERDDRV